MIILIPMGGKGTRFSEAGYTRNKACIPTTDRHTGKALPMVICAMKDIPEIYDPNNTIICIDRDFHNTNGTEQQIRDFFPNVIFIHDHAMQDQAFACFLARKFLTTDEELFITSCDSGFSYDQVSFDKARNEADVLMISHTNDNNIANNPKAHSWAKLNDPTSQRIESLSLKQPVSDSPMNDHATTGLFWFKRASDFLKHLESMIANKDTLHGKYYVDQVLQYCINAGLNVQYFDVAYFCWGTPHDYEIYEKTIHYWREFAREEGFIT